MTQSNWDNLPTDQKASFYAKADPDSDLTGEDWFNHLVPEQIQGDPEKVDVFMNGGTVTTEEWTYDRGRGSGHYETVEHELPDRDISRVESGANGGEYTPDNTIMEDASINRSRGADNMTDTEYSAATEANEYHASLLEDAQVVVERASGTDAVDIAVTTSEAASAGNIFTDAADVVLEGLLPAIVATRVGAHVASTQTTTQDKLGYGMLSAGGTALLAMTPPGQLACTCWAVWSLGKLGYKTIQRAYHNAEQQIV